MAERNPYTCTQSRGASSLLNLKKHALLWLSVGLVIALLIGGAAWWALQNARPAPLQIALSMPLSIEVGQEIVNAVQLAIQDSEQPVELVQYDILDSGLSEIERRNIEIAQDIIANPHIMGVIGGPNTDFTREVLPLFNEHDLVLISPLATGPGLTKSGYGAGEPGIYYPSGKRNFFRTIPSDDLHGITAARWMDTNEWRRVFVITAEFSSYSRVLGGILEANADEYRLTIAGSTTFDERVYSNDPAAATDITERILQEVRASAPDVVYLPMIAQINQENILYALREQLPEVTVIGGDGMTYQDYPSEYFAQLNGIFATSVLAEPRQLPSASAFIEAYTAAYGTPPTAVALSSYDATLALLRAISAASPNPTRSQVLDAMQALGEIEGSMGAWHFTPEGDIEPSIVSVQRFNGGVWEFIDVFR